MAGPPSLLEACPRVHHLARRTGFAPEEFVNVAIDPNVTRINPESNPASAIENEIPAYRAISPLAITSLILGALSILSFAHWFFLVSPWPRWCSASWPIGRSAASPTS